MSVAFKGKKITPLQLAQKWATLPNKFEVNIFNFETIIGDKVKDIFLESFYLKKLNAPGTTVWKNRVKEKPYPLLNETGQLKESITYKHLSSNIKSKNKGVKIFSDPNKFNTGKTRHRGFYYAYVHNHGEGYIPPRPFIGKSSYVTDTLKKYTYRIFDGFPK